MDRAATTVSGSTLARTMRSASQDQRGWPERISLAGDRQAPGPRCACLPFARTASEPCTGSRIAATVDAATHQPPVLRCERVRRGNVEIRGECSAPRQRFQPPRRNARWKGVYGLGVPHSGIARKAMAFGKSRTNDCGRPCAGCDRTHAPRADRRGEAARCVVIVAVPCLAMAGFPKLMKTALHPVRVPIVEHLRDAPNPDARCNRRRPIPYRSCPGTLQLPDSTRYQTRPQSALT